jgi:Fur family transcriptional regulator, peroxide stress response regulator
MNKKSKQREAIIRIIKNTSSHPSAEWIYEQVKKEIPNIGLATVYRNLRLLKQSGELRELHPSTDTARYDGCIDSHYHFYCDRCGKVLDLDEPVDTAVEARITEKTGLEITHHNLILNGLCIECQKLGPHSDDNLKKQLR